jgi:FAD/FMN-containing dehydrogenase
MMDRMTGALNRLAQQLRGRLSLPGDERYGVATAIWAKPVGRMPRAVVHCRTPEDVQLAIRTARDCASPLSVRGGGHDWAGRGLCDGIVIDLSSMNRVVVGDKRIARISGGARAAHVAAVTDQLGLAAVTGSVGAVGMAGLTLGGGYGPLIGRCGLALDNLVSAEVVLADGRIIVADRDNEPELFWALRGGGGGFGVVTSMHHRLHQVPSVRSGLLFYPFREARTVLERCAEIAVSAPDDLTVQVGCVGGPDGAPMALVWPTWCGLPCEGEARLAPFLKLGRPTSGALDLKSYGTSLTSFDPYLVDGQRTFMESCWLPVLDASGIDLFIQAMEMAVSPGCAVFTHEFRGAASRVPLEATAFGLRRDHVLVEILATFADRSDELEERLHRQWVQATLRAFDPISLPGGYPNFLPPGDVDRAAKSYGPNAERLARAKQHYDPENVFCSTIPLPVSTVDKLQRDNSTKSARGL